MTDGMPADTCAVANLRGLRAPCGKILKNSEKSRNFASETAWRHYNSNSVLSPWDAEGMYHVLRVKKSCFYKRDEKYAPAGKMGESKNDSKGSASPALVVHKRMGKSHEISNKLLSHGTRKWKTKPICQPLAGNTKSKYLNPKEIAWEVWFCKTNPIIK